MLLLITSGVISIMLWYFVWYMKTYHEDWYFFNDFWICALAISSVVATFFMALVIILAQCGSGSYDADVIEAIKSRPRIIAELKSEDIPTHNLGVDEAIEYNQKVKAGKNKLESLWTNWLTSRMWADVEYIEVDVDSYVIIPQTKE